MLCCRFLTLLLAGLMSLMALASSHAQTPSGSPLTIGVLVSSDKNRCYEPGTVMSIRHFTTAAGREASQRLKRPVTIQVLDDFEDPQTTIANVKTALADPHLVALVGLSSSTRAKALFSEMGGDINARKVPFLSEISLDSVLSGQPSLFSMANTAADELHIIKRFLKDRNVQRPVFVGIDGDDYSTALGDGLKLPPEAVTLAADHRMAIAENKLSDADLTLLVNDIALQKPDMLILALQSGPGAQLVQQLVAKGLDLPIFVLYGRVSRILTLAGVGAYAHDAFEIGREGVPNLTNERLRQRLWRQADADWIFADTPNLATPGWSDGRCVETKSDVKASALSDANRRAIGRGTQYADMVALVARALETPPNDAGSAVSIEALRQRVMTHLGKMTRGQAIERGLWQDWTFSAKRTSGDNALIIQRPAGTMAMGLANWQYRPSPDTPNALLRTPVIYLSLDMINLSRIDTSEQSFDAEFYLSLASDDGQFKIDSLEFTNAARSSATRTPLIEWREIKATAINGDSAARAAKLYKVSGRFAMSPELRAYPFDTQRLSIAFQPSSTAQPFIVQPSPPIALASLPPVDGWTLMDRYFGTDQDIIPTVVSASGEVRPVGYAKFNDTWIVKRQGHDFYLRVVLPLIFILLITYFSAFLTHDRFESIMGIQVTALLSAIALNLSQPIIGTNELSLSDRAFIVTYAAITVMSALSVLKDAKWVRTGGTIHHSISLVQKVGYPVMVVSLLGWLLQSGLPYSLLTLFEVTPPTG
jgi:Periplasmic binding protein